MSKQDLQSSVELFAWTARELPIRFLGDELLKTVCQPVGKQEFATNDVKKIADELLAVLTKYREHTGMGRGLAANQIGYNKRMVAVWLDQKPEVFCNPEVVSSDGLGSYWESCISSGALLVGEVYREWTANFRYCDTSGKEHIFEADEKQTRVLLHEIDHLDGITCNEKYQAKTEKIVTGGKEEILGFKFKQIA
jgi:peptide deformylase